MKDCFYQYRKGLYERLSTLTYEGVPIPVMEYAPDEQNTPYIQISDMSASFERDDDRFMQKVTTDIIVVTSHNGPPDDFGSKQSDDIMNDIMELLITRGVTPADRARHITMTDFEDCGCFLLALNYNSDFDGAKITVRKILTIETSIDEV
jgi:hypothetical protein